MAVSGDQSERMALLHLLSVKGSEAGARVLPGGFERGAAASSTLGGSGTNS